MGAAAALISASILISRLLGLGREALLATLIGVNTNGDLYRQAFLIPDFLNYLLAGAYLTITLIPILSRHLEQDDPDGASRAFTSVFRFVGWAILGLTVAMWLAAEPIVSLVFPRVPEPERLVSLTRLVLPAQVFLVMGALLMAVQYTHRRFLFPALAPIIYNLGIIAGGLIGAAIGEAGPEAFLWGAVIGSAVGNFGLQWFGARSTGTWLTRVPRGRSSVKEYLILALPLMLGQSVAVLDEQFVRLFGQIDVGATAALSFARQLNMVPVGVIAQAAGVAAFPFLARLAAGGKEEELTRTTGRAARNTVFVAAAAMAALVVLARPLVSVLYEHGEFTAADASLVARLLVLYAFSIPAWGLHQILSRHFYAKRMMWRVVLIGTIGTLIAIPVWLGLYSAMGIEGFALASTLVMTAYAVALLVAWGLDSGWSPVRSLVPSILRGLIAAGVAAVVAYPIVSSIFDGESIDLWDAIAAAAVGGLTTIAVFLGVSYLLRAPELRDLMRRT
ncbi:MAG: murein biosynthesis integral membrane protein MurJ [Acidimicrobiia bacterium]